MAGQVEAGNHLCRWLRKTSTAQEVDRAENVPAALDSVKIEIAVQGTDHYVWLSEVKKMIDEAFMESDKKNS